MYSCCLSPPFPWPCVARSLWPYSLIYTTYKKILMNPKFGHPTWDKEKILLHGTINVRNEFWIQASRMKQRGSVQHSFAHKFRVDRTRERSYILVRRGVVLTCEEEEEERKGFENSTRSHPPPPRPLPNGHHFRRNAKAECEGKAHATSQTNRLITLHRDGHGRH